MVVHWEALLAEHWAESKAEKLVAMRAGSSAMQKAAYLAVCLVAQLAALSAEYWAG